MKRHWNWLKWTFIGTIAAVGSACAGGLDSKRFGEPTDLGSPLTNISIQHCVVGTEGGEPTAYYTVAGKPALFHVVRLNDNRLLGTYELPHAARSWNHVIASDGSVYIAGVALGSSAHVYRYLPEEQKVVDLGPGVKGHKFIWALAAGDDGRVYGGTWEGGHVFEYNPATDEIRDLGRVDPTEDYVRSIAWHDGFVYAGTGTRNGRVWRIDPDSGEKEKLELPVREEYAAEYDRIRSVYHLAVAGDHLFAFFNGPRVMLAYDLDKREWWDETIPFGRGPVTGAYYEDENAFYYPGAEDALWAIDLETREQRKAMRYRGGFRGGSFVEVEGFPGKTLATVFGSGAVGLLNPQSGAGRTLDSHARGQGTNLQAMEAGPGGALYLSGYMGSSGAAYDPQSGESRLFQIGQAEGLVQLGDRLYWGVYPGGRLYEQYPLSEDIKPDFLGKIGQGQDRPFAMISAADKVFVGTIPDYGELGGALTVLLPNGKGGIETAVYRNVVEKQSIVGLAYRDGLLFGSTAIAGGLGIEPEAEAAKMFVWDVAAGKKLEEFSLDLPGLEAPSMIGGLSVGPDGLIWGAVNGFIFALDPETRDVVKQKNIYPDVTRYGRWRPVYLRWHDDGLLYTNLAGNLTAIDPATLAHVDLGVDSGLLAIGSDGNLYFAKGSELRMITVRTTAGK